jgi:glycosyltransferase involved in cell wall biosynthesis
VRTSSLSIGFVTVADLPEGCGRTGRLRSLVAALVGMGHRVHIWNQHGLEASGAEQSSGEMAGAYYEYVLGTTARQRGFRAIRLKIRAVKRILAEVSAAARVGRLDLIFFNNLAFYDTFPITRLAQRLEIPTIQCYEDERFEIVARHHLGLAQRVFGWNSWAADRWCSPLATQIWVISSYLQTKYALLSGDASRVRIIPTIIDCEAWSMPPEPIHPVPVILYSGGFGDQDDMEKLIRALSFLEGQNVPFHMRFLGARPELPRVKQLKCLVRDLKLESRLEFRGFCLAETVKQEVRNANILVNLRTNSVWSRSGLSTKLSEYLAAGRTVLTTDIGDNARYVEHGRSALVVCPDSSAETVATALKEAIERPAWRRKLGEGAREAALAHFDLHVIQQTIDQALREIP